MDQVVCETKRCEQRAAAVRFYDARGGGEHRLCVWCALEQREVAKARRQEAGAPHWLDAHEDRREAGEEVA